LPIELKRIENEIIIVESIKKIYHIGFGPSSSHTMAPSRASEIFKIKNPNAVSFKVTLYGSLAATGKGHMTDVAITKMLEPATVEIIWKPEEVLPVHPNGMKFEALDDNAKTIDEWITYSLGGGALYEPDTQKIPKIYSLNKMSDILSYLNKAGKSFWEYIEECEGKEIWDYLAEVWKTMQEAVKRGLENEGVLPGVLNLQRKASAYYTRSQGFTGTLKRKAVVFSYALAVSEENASGSGIIVTAPTCGSCGVLPSVLYHLSKDYEATDAKIIKALATAGLIGNLVKKNASISGAEVGCQGEVGTACAMASGAAAQLFGGTVFQVEYAASMGIEHHLGLTCDPVAGLVQIPCIERNAFAAARALDASAYSLLSDGRHRVNFDVVVKAMKHTGHDLPSIYRETAEGGLAKYTKYYNKE